MTISITLDSQLVNAVGQAMAKKDVRYYLNGLNIKKIGPQCRIAGTNGHVLLMAGVDCGGVESGGSDFEFTVPRSLVENKAKGKSVTITWDPPKSATEGAGTVTVTDLGISASAPAIDGRYPDVSRVVPAECSGVTAQFQGDVLLVLDKASRAMGKKGFFTLHHNGQNGAIVRIGDVYGVAMPLRDSECESPLSIPGWAKI